jgi:hypothetical protein
MELEKNKNKKRNIKKVRLINNKKTLIFIKKKQIKYPKYFLYIKIFFVFLFSIIVKIITFIIL